MYAWDLGSLIGTYLTFKRQIRDAQCTENFLEPRSPEVFHNIMQHLKKKWGEFIKAHQTSPTCRTDGIRNAIEFIRYVL